MSERADILIVNAKALTIDPDRPRASVIAIQGNRIMAVGDDNLAALGGSISTDCYII